MVGEWLNTEKIIDENAIKPCHRLLWCPYGPLVEEFKLREENKRNKFSCEVFGHDCPVFYHKENEAEDFGPKDYEEEIDVLLQKGGFTDVFKEDPIAEYWYDKGYDHSTKDNIQWVNCALDKLIEEGKISDKDTMSKLRKKIKSLTNEQVEQWASIR